MSIPPIDPTGRPMVFAKPGRQIVWIPVPMAPEKAAPKGAIGIDGGALLERWTISASLPPLTFLRAEGYARYVLAWDALGVGIPERIVLVDDEDRGEYPDNDFAAEAVARVSLEGAMYAPSLIVAGTEPEAIAAHPHRVVVLILVGALENTPAGRRLALAGGGRLGGSPNGAGGVS